MLCITLPHTRQSLSSPQTFLFARRHDSCILGIFLQNHIEVFVLGLHGSKTFEPKDLLYRPLRSVVCS